MSWEDIYHIQEKNVELFFFQKNILNFYAVTAIKCNLTYRVGPADFSGHVAVQGVHIVTSLEFVGIWCAYCIYWVCSVHMFFGALIYWSGSSSRTLQTELCVSVPAPAVTPDAQQKIPCLTNFNSNTCLTNKFFAVANWKY